MFLQYTKTPGDLLAKRFLDKPMVQALPESPPKLLSDQNSIALSASTRCWCHCLWPQLPTRSSGKDSKELAVVQELAQDLVSSFTI